MNNPVARQAGSAIGAPGDTIIPQEHAGRWSASRSRQVKQENAMNAHARELVASRACTGEERRVVHIGDSGQKGTDIYWSEPVGKWVIINLEPTPRLTVAEEIALVRLHQDADPDAIAGRALACDLENEKALFLINAAQLADLTSYGPSMELLWASSPKARQASLALAS
jgi:hypothetical protein